MNATLDAMVRVLFQSWFVDFDPVRAKLDGRKPDGLDKPTAALFPAAFQDSNLAQSEGMDRVQHRRPRDSNRDGPLWFANYEGQLRTRWSPRGAWRKPH